MPKIAVISVAHVHSRGYCNNIAESVSSKAPYAIWDENPKRGQEYADGFKCKFEPDLDKLVADPKIDGFMVCAENTRHLPLLRKAIPAGKPILCEKPLATEPADADEIVALAHKHKTPIICAYHLPYNGGNLAVMELIKKNELGKVTHFNFRNAHHAAYARWFDSPDFAWFTEPELSGGGALLDMGTHAVQFLRHACGSVEEVWADIRNLSGVYPKVDDYGLVIMKFKSGVIGRAEAGWVFTGGHGGLEVIGSQKSVWNASGLKIGGPDSPAQPVTALPDKPRQVARLLAAIRGEIPADELEADLQASRDAVKIMAAAYESAKTGKWVACG